MAGIGLFAALDIGISGMNAARLATGVANHNIANANTPGYARQSLRLGTARPLGLTFGVFGRGVEAQGIDRSRSVFLERQFTEQNSVLGEYGAMDDALRSVEEILGSMDSDRLGAAMSEFFNAWSDLSTPPPTEGKRQSVVSQAQRLALEFREIDSSLDALEREARSTFEDYVDDTNTLLQGIARLNEDIVANTVGEQLPNDLMDQRTQLLAELSQITNFRLNERDDGTVDVVIEGRMVVNRGHVNEVRVQESENADGQIVQRAVFGGRDPVEIEFQTGAIAGQQRAANEMLPKIRGQIDDLARRLISQVNAIHEQGSTAIGRGVSLFEGTGAGSIAVNEAIASDLRLLATGRSGDDGDNTIALEIAALGSTLQPGEDKTLNEAYAQMIVSVASDRGTFSTLREGQAGIVETVSARLESVRGVNLDEELANLVMFQRTYEANARVIRTIDQMLDTLVNGLI